MFFFQKIKDKILFFSCLYVQGLGQVRNYYGVSSRYIGSWIFPAGLGKEVKIRPNSGCHSVLRKRFGWGPAGLETTGARIKKSTIHLFSKSKTLDCINKIYSVFIHLQNQFYLAGDPSLHRLHPFMIVSRIQDRRERTLDYKIKQVLKDLKMLDWQL